MKKIILTAIGLACSQHRSPPTRPIPASPSTKSTDTAWIGILRPSRSRWERRTASWCRIGCGQSFGLTLGTNPAGAQFSRPYYAPPHQTPQDIYEPIHR
jgi:hypothetical protein